MVLSPDQPPPTVPGIVFCFGLVTMCTAFVKSYAGIAVTRALLGIFEGGAMPATAFFLTCYYKKSELFFRMSIFIASSSLANSFGGLLAAVLRYARPIQNPSTRRTTNNAPAGFRSGVPTALRSGRGATFSSSRAS